MVIKAFILHRINDHVTSGMISNTISYKLVRPKLLRMYYYRRGSGAKYSKLLFEKGERNCAIFGVCVNNGGYCTVLVAMKEKKITSKLFLFF